MDEKDKLIQKLLERISALEKIVAEQAVIIKQQALLIEEQAEIIKQQAARIAELEKRIDKNSQNSSKPPSSDGLRKKPQNNREKTTKKTGGQVGHAGTTLKRGVADKSVVLAVLSCEECGNDLSQCVSDEVEIRQVHDMPPIDIEVTEYLAEKKRCCCGHMTEASFPNGVNYSVQYGSKIKGFALYLHNEQKLPYARCCELLSDYFGVSFSEGTLFNTQQASYTHLATIEKKTKATLINQQVLNTDETGLRVKKSLHWLHVASTTNLTLYHIDAKRGKTGMDAMGVLPEFKGVAVHDHWKSYYRYTNFEHALCNAHHLRELKAFEEDGQIWAGKMRVFLKETCHLVNEQERAEKLGLPDSIRDERLRTYRAILAEGENEIPLARVEQTKKRGRPKQSKGRNLLHRLREFETDVLRFAFDFRVPFTNNQAERDIRMVKLKQKISGSFRSIEGAKMFARITGYISTLRKQNINIANAMTALADGNPILPNFC